MGLINYFSGNGEEIKYFLVIGGQKRGYLHPLYTYTTMNNTYVCFYTEIIDFNIK